jgi:dTDP-4-amino-4,6-dideoxygalactose transaminase
MIPRLKPTLGWQELAALLPPAGEKEIERFEQAFAQLMGQKHAIAFPYGRTGLFFLLEALGLKEREVICPAYTCVVVPHAIVTSGNEPVFVDSQEEDFNMNLDLVPEAITEKTGAIVATSIFGYPVDLDRLDKIRQQHPQIPIIQDCAHSFAAEWKGRPVHQAGDAAIFGLNISKILTSIFGGMVTTDRDDLADKLRQLRKARIQPPTWEKSWRRRLYLAAIYPAFTAPIYGMTNALERSGLLNRFVKYYDEGIIEMPTDYLVGMTGVEAKVGQVQVGRYHDIIANRRKVAEFYDKHLQGIPNLILPPLVEGATYSHYVPRTEHRQELMQYALKHGVQLGQIIEYCIPQMSAYRDLFGSRFACPVAQNMAKATVNLPIFIKPDIANNIVRVLQGGL